MVTRRLLLFLHFAFLYPSSLRELLVHAFLYQEAGLFPAAAFEVLGEHLHLDHLEDIFLPDDTIPCPHEVDTLAVLGFNLLEEVGFDCCLIQ